MVFRYNFQMFKRPLMLRLCTALTISFAVLAPVNLMFIYVFTYILQQISLIRLEIFKIYKEDSIFLFSPYFFIQTVLKSLSMFVGIQFSSIALGIMLKLNLLKRVRRKDSPQDSQTSSLKRQYILQGQQVACSVIFWNLLLDLFRCSQIRSSSSNLQSKGLESRNTPEQRSIMRSNNRKYSSSSLESQPSISIRKSFRLPFSKGTPQMYSPFYLRVLFENQVIANLHTQLPSISQRLTILSSNKLFPEFLFPYTPTNPTQLLQYLSNTSTPSSSKWMTFPSTDANLITLCSLKPSLWMFTRSSNLNGLRVPQSRLGSADCWMVDGFWQSLTSKASRSLRCC